MEAKLQKLRNRHFFMADAVLIVLIPWLALLLMGALPGSEIRLPEVIKFTLLALVIKLSIYHYFNIYRKYWPFASIDSVISILIGVCLSSLVVIVIFFISKRFGLLDLPGSTPFLDGLLTLVSISGIRLGTRIASHLNSHQHREDEECHHVLVAGAGEAGQIVVREILNSDFVNYHLVGFVDDNPNKIGTTIHGARVLGPLESIPEHVANFEVNEVIIAMPASPGEVIRRVVAACEVADVRTRTLPGIYELLSGEVDISRLREVEITDLLRREPVRIDPAQVKRLLREKNILVTGAGGSIGKELCLQIAACQPTRLVALGHGENSLHALQTRFKNSPAFKDCPLEVVIADVRDTARLEVIFSRYELEVVFHAAAHKHVPLMEDNLEEAVTNNVLGTWNLVQTAQAHGVERFVLISTDKAVEPINVMGMTKRVAELIVREAGAKTGRPYVCVRFGNVLGSRGSVIPIFKRQIEAGGPVTVTHPDVERYFMTIPEAVQLVLQAFALGENGEVFVLDMGAPIKIQDLARDMIELSGYKTGREVEIVYTGLRPGERLKEALFSPGETQEHTRHEKIYVARNGTPATSVSLHTEIIQLETLAKEGNTTALRQKLAEIAAGTI